MTFSKLFSKTILIPLFVAAVTISCQNNEKKNVTEEVSEQSEMTLDQKKQQLESATPASSSDAAALPPGSVNPPHGQPGHRCDIPVGAPLDESGSQNNVSVEPTQTPSTPPANPGNTGPKPELNPAHGQPWHRCDIKVGDPLP